jgi:hypothetical protein
MITRKTAFLVPVIAAFLIACGTTLQVLSPEATGLLLPWLDDRPTKAIVIERLGDVWPKYADVSGRVLIYAMAKGTEGEVSPARGKPGASHELVLVFDENERLQRYSPIRVK